MARCRGIGKPYHFIRLWRNQSDEDRTKADIRPSRSLIKTSDPINRASLYVEMPSKAQQKTKNVAATKGDELKHRVPDWPALQPLLPAGDFTLEVLLPDQILTIPRFWTSNLCNTYVKFLSTLPLTTTPGKPKKGEAVRVNDRFQVEDPIFAERLWSGTALKELVTSPVIDEKPLTSDETTQLWSGEVLGLNSNIRIYRYSKGQFFDQHCKSLFVSAVLTHCRLF